MVAPAVIAAGIGGATKLLSGLFGGNKKQSQNSFVSGSRFPVLSQDWQNAFKAASGGLNAGGYTPQQQTAVDFLGRRMETNPIRPAVDRANADYDTYKTSLDDIIGGYNWLTANRGDYALGGAPTEQYVGDVIAGRGIDGYQDYMNPFTNDVINASAADYDAGTDRAANTMRARRDAAGAFGDRSAVADAVFQADAARGRASLLSGLRAQGFDTAIGYSMADKDRKLLADTGNQQTRQGVNTRNTNLLDSRERYNIGLQQDRDTFMQQNLEGIRGALGQQTGLTQQQLDNIITADGIDVETANAMFRGGQIGQGQLLAILEAARVANGDTYSENRSGDASFQGPRDYSQIGQGATQIFDLF